MSDAPRDHTPQDHSAQDSSPQDPASLRAARDAAAAGALNGWVASFLASPGSDNAALAAQLCEPPRRWLGPVELPLDRLHRLAGPEDVDDQPVLAPMDDDDLERSEDMADSIEDGWEPPPAIVTWSGGQLVVEDGNHRIEALRRAGASVCWCVVSSEDDAELARLAAELGAEVVPDRLGGGAPVR